MKLITSFWYISFSKILPFFIYFYFAIFSNYTSAQIQNIGGIINSYASIDSLDVCNNRLYLDQTQYGTFSAGDTILIIQMKGADLFENLNTQRFGKVRDFKKAGNYEINYIKTIQAGYIELKNTLINSYNIGSARLQIVSIPQYKDADITQTLNPLDWNGKIGGVLIFFVSGTLSFSANIDASGSGFEGGISNNILPAFGNCAADSFFYAKGSALAAAKGYSYANTSDSAFAGKGKMGSGGGGGQGFSSGGGGGGNGGIGGTGGQQNNVCNNLIMNGGLGGDSIPYSILSNKLFMGSGGGGGHVSTMLTKNNGGSGGGLIIIQAKEIEGNGMKIECNGVSGNECQVGGKKCIEGMGGGGAGGSVFLISKKINSKLNIEAKGGKGADISFNNIDLYGPGGGGGGGALLISENSLQTNLEIDIEGGVFGTNVMLNDPHGAENGKNGIIQFNQQIQKSFQPFYINQKDISINYFDTGCTDLALKASAIDIMDTLINYTWSFSDGYTASGQNVIHTFSNSGNYSVKLSYSDLSGCLFSFDTFAIVKSFNLIVEPDKSKCKKTPIQVNLSTNSYAVNWSPGYLFSDSTIVNPIYQDVVSQYVFASASFAGGCLLKDSMKIDIIPPTIFSINGDTSLCYGDSIILNAAGADTYIWSPAISLSNINNNSTIASPLQTTTYSVFLTNNTCYDTTTLQTTVLVNAAPIIKLKKSNDINCTQTSALLYATGSSSYTWLPANEYEIVNFSTIRVYPFKNTLFHAIGTGLNSCIGRDSIEVFVGFSSYDFYLPNAFTPNNDGLNDYFRVKYIPPIKKFELCIYNRFGQLIFKTNDYRQSWDGRFKSINQPSGSYLYTLKAETSCGFIDRKDFVQLIR